MLYIPYPFRRCAECGADYLPNRQNFYTTEHRRDRLWPICKPCHNAQNKTRYYANHDKYLANQKIYRETNRDKVKHQKKAEYYRHQEGYKTRAKQYYYANRADVLAKMRRRTIVSNALICQRKRDQWKRRGHIYRANKRQKYISNPRYREQVRIGRTRFYANNPHKQAEYSQRRKDRERGRINAFTDTDRLRMLEYWHSRCAYCGNPPGLLPAFRLTEDHFIPLISSDCPGTVPTNMLPACQSCNCSKQDRDPAEWLTERFGPRKARRKLQEISAYFAQIANPE